MARGARIAFELRAGPLAEADVDVLRVDGYEGLSEPYAFAVQLAPRDGEPFDLEAVLGREAVLTMRRPTGEERIVHGEALRVELAGVAAGKPLYVVWIAPRLARLARVVRSRVFLDRTFPEVVDEVLGEHAIARRLDLSGSYPARELVVQHRESDLAFVSRLLEGEGIWWRFEHSEGGHELVLADAPGAYADLGAALPLRRDAAQGDGVEHLSRLSRTHRLVPGAVALRDFDFARPGLDLEARAEEQGAAPEVHEWPGGYRDPAEGRRLGRTRLEEARHGAETFEGRSTAVALQPGTALDVEGEARVLAVRVRHAGEQERAAGGAEAVKARYENAFEGIEASRPYRPPRRTPAPRIAGLQTATVVGPAGEEIHTDAHGRVKVLFHWDREGAREDRSSAWVRVAQAWAGAGMGASFVPRVGQEVVVRFLDGDPDRPLVTGAVYDGANPPPLELPMEKTRATLRSDSSPGSDGSNELRFEDQAGSEQVYLHAERDHAVEVGEESVAEVRASATLDVGADRTQAILGSQALDVAGDDQEGVGGVQNLAVALGRETRVGGSQEERVGLAQAVTVGGVQEVSVGAVSSVRIGAAAALNVGAVYAVNVGGAVNEAVLGLKASQVAGEALVAVGAHHEERVGAERSATVGGDDERAVQGSAGLAVGGDATADAGGSAHVAAGPGSTWSAGKQELQATRLTIEVGGKPALVMDDQGNVQVLATNATIDGSALQLKGAAVKKIQPQSVQQQEDFVELELVDDEGNPVANEPFELHLANGEVRKGRLDGGGKARVEGVPPGGCRAVFPGFRAREE
ncbi:MAG TPA: type VI secretion system tip protein TssI/VgrG [Anaeromyxobacter sp.]|nr:type VI secretion system tip protein TssI/VgrG [Anaeromyxobacter sp.]